MINRHCDRAAPKYFAIRCTPSLASIFHGKGKFSQKRKKEKEKCTLTRILIVTNELPCRWLFWSEHLSLLHFKYKPIPRAEQWTIFIPLQNQNESFLFSYDAFQIADPCRMQYVCHIWT